MQHGSRASASHKQQGPPVGNDFDASRIGDMAYNAKGPAASWVPRHVPQSTALRCPASSTQDRRKGWTPARDHDTPYTKSVSTADQAYSDSYPLPRSSFPVLR